MPNVNGKKYPYTASGIAAARKSAGASMRGAGIGAAMGAKKRSMPLNEQQDLVSNLQYGPQGIAPRKPRPTMAMPSGNTMAAGMGGMAGARLGQKIGRAQARARAQSRMRRK